MDRMAIVVRRTEKAVWLFGKFYKNGFNEGVGMFKIHVGHKGVECVYPDGRDYFCPVVLATDLICPAVDFTGADLIDAELSEANLIGANLSGANLTGAKLIRAELSGANLRGANLKGANLTKANLTGANLTGADLTDAIIDDGKGNEYVLI
jgi:hypothetical protein